MGSTLPSRDSDDRHDPHAAGALKPASGLLASLTAIVALTTDKGPAGRMLRTVLPIALVLIGLSGVGALGAHRLGFVGIAVGAGLFAIANGVIVVAAIYWSAWLLHAEYTDRRRAQDQIRSHALHDPLTGLANRGFFIDQLARRAALADRRTSVPFAICSLDVDGFSHVNAQLGREAGNQILIKVGEVIRDCVRASDLVARLDGDKFGILLEEIADAKDVNILAQRIVSSVPNALAEIADAPISVSIGIVLKSSGHDLPDDMLRDADAALKLAKKRGPGRFELTAFAS